ncbi:MAG: hypothetical protein CL613_03605 [Aquimarina sp.]|nr:hypothetical protein [Aquimarina sp.]
MKNFKSLFLAITFFVPFTFFAQETEVEKELTKETMVKTYKVDKGNMTIPYEVKIKNKVEQPIKLEKEDKKELNQDRIVDTDKMVTKSIWIDSDVDDMYDNYIELSYVKEADEDFMIESNTKGFVIKVRGKEMNYSFLDKEYVIKEEDNNFFIITERESK